MSDDRRSGTGSVRKIFGGATVIVLLASAIGAALLYGFSLVYPETPVSNVAVLTALLALAIASGLYAIWRRMRESSPPSPPPVLLLAVAVGAFGCSAPPNNAAGPIPAAPPEAHLWDELRTEGDELPGFGLYTYVLVNRSITSSVSRAAAARYDSLVAAIEASTLAEGEVRPDSVDRARYNLFLLPTLGGLDTSSAGDTLHVGGATEAEAVDLDLDDLNDVLSMRVLQAIARETEDAALRRQLRRDAGPFLISAVRPISRPESAEGSIDLLYANLSGTHPSAMREVVSVYKQRIEEDVVDETERMGSFRLRLLSVLLNADTHVRTVRTSLAALVPGLIGG